MDSRVSTSVNHGLDTAPTPSVPESPLPLTLPRSFPPPRHLPSLSSDYDPTSPPYPTHHTGRHTQRPLHPRPLFLSLPLCPYLPFRLLRSDLVAQGYSPGPDSPPLPTPPPPKPTRVARAHPFAHPGQHAHRIDPVRRLRLTQAAHQLVPVHRPPLGRADHKWTGTQTAPGADRRPPCHTIDGRLRRPVNRTRRRESRHKRAGSGGRGDRSRS